MKIEIRYFLWKFDYEQKITSVGQKTWVLLIYLPYYALPFYPKVGIIRK